MEAFQANVLSWILFSPLIAAALLLLIPAEQKQAIRWLANILMFGCLLVTLPLVMWFQNETPGFQFVERYDWIPSLGASYHLGLDGISYLLVMLTAVLGFLAVLSSWNLIQERVKEYYVMFFILQAGMLGVFLSLDFFLFYVFWEVMLVPMYFIIGVWGHERKLYAAIKFFLYTLLGSVLMLLGILWLYYHHAGLHAGAALCPVPATVAGHTPYTFSVPVYLELGRYLPFDFISALVFWGFFISFAIKVPMVPFHTWLPDAHVEAPTAGSVILAGVLLKMGTYGMMRFSLPIFPEASRHYAPFVAAVSIVAIIYGALVCMMQKDMKKLIAYSSVSHLGFCTLGIFCLNQAGLEGSLLQQVNHGITTGALFLIVGLLYERRHTRLISDFGGLSTPMPNFAAIYLIISLASLGMPLLNGFIGEFVILQGAWQVNKWWAVFAVLGVVLAAAYLLWLFQRVMFGEVSNPKNVALADVSFREAATLVPLVLWAFWIGIYPAQHFDAMRSSITLLVERANVAPAEVVAAAPAATAQAPPLQLEAAPPR